MGPMRKISREANGPVVVVIATAVSHPGQHQREMMVGVGVRLQARRELLQQMLPQYRAASSAQKREFVNALTQITGYHRKYAMWLLNHAQDGPPVPPDPRPRHYGPEVQEALVRIWDHANRICAKRLIPFLPTFLETLERTGHLHLSEICRQQLLTMSAATADRLLQQVRRRGPYGLSTTRAGTLLKQQIPIRTFQHWDQTHPGFLEADVVAHCGTDVTGNYLCTLTLTDIATGWTECLPLLYKSQETVREALRQAHQLFPFPILGLDTDNGAEFINEVLLAYCDSQQITFTRGREHLKNDQCYVEQKNGAIVRQVVGYDRFVGVQAFQQLGEIYQALRLYSNGFQPSMKLQGTFSDGRKVRRMYDQAKTPLQHLLLSEVLPAAQEHALRERFQALDPVRLFEQIQELQQALFIHSTNASPRLKEAADVPVQRFSLLACSPGSPPSDVLTQESTLKQSQAVDELPSISSLLQWHRTRNDPFKEVWDLIASWVLVQPERTSGEILRELQRLFPGRYQSSHQRTLQRGLRQIRARLHATVVVCWQQNETHTHVPDPAFAQLSEPQTRKTDYPAEAMLPLPAQRPSQSQTPDPFMPQGALEEEHMAPQKTAPHPEGQPAPLTSVASFEQCSSFHPSAMRPKSRRRRSSLTMEQAIYAYLEAQRKGKRRPKTLEWHQTALHLFQQYLHKESRCLLIEEITETQIQGWLRFLHETPNARGMLRSTGTIQSYIRSVRAFCQWLVQQRYLQRTPCPQRLLPIVEPSLPRLLDNRTGNAYCRPVRLLEESQPWSSKRRHAIVPCSGYFLRRGCVPLNSVTCASRMSIVSRVSSRYEGKVPRHDGSH